MKKLELCLSLLIVSAGLPLLAQSDSSNEASSDCSQLSQREQNFANQIVDMNNKSMFCSQFTSQQRQEAIQLMGQPDDAGNMMDADQAVQQVMGMPPASTKARPSRGGCPVK